MSEAELAGIRLLNFTKLNEYPEPRSTEANELTRLLDVLETALIQSGVVDANYWRRKHLEASDK